MPVNHFIFQRKNINRLYDSLIIFSLLFPIGNQAFSQTGHLDSVRRAEEYLSSFHYNLNQDYSFRDESVYPMIILNKSGFTKAVLPLPNAQKPLNIPTYDSSGQAIHPSVIDFLNEYFIPGWNGYRFWMAFTPYPYTNAQKENPSLAASHDGINWEIPEGIVNPIVKPPKEMAGENLADPDLIYNEQTNELWLYYMYREKNKDTAAKFELIRIRKDLSHSAPLPVISFPGNDSLTLVSPCFWRESASRWHLWAVRLKNPNHIAYLFSTDGIHWSPQKLCYDKSGNNPLHQIGYRAWHISCKPNYRENRIEFMVNCSRGAWESTPSNKSKALLYAEAEMDNPSLMTVPINIPIIFCSQITHHWDHPIIYRTSFAQYDTNHQYFYKAWYSGASYQDGTWHTGFTEGNLGNYYSDLRVFAAETIEDEIIIDSKSKTVAVYFHGNENDSVLVKLYKPPHRLIFEKWISGQKTDIDIELLPPAEYIAFFLYRNYSFLRIIRRK